MDTVQKLFRFLDESPTCYHAAANAKAALTAAGADLSVQVLRL